MKDSEAFQRLFEGIENGEVEATIENTPIGKKFATGDDLEMSGDLFRAASHIGRNYARDVEAIEAGNYEEVDIEPEMREEFAQLCEAAIEAVSTGEVEEAITDE